MSVGRSVGYLVKTQEESGGETFRSINEDSSNNGEPE